MKSGKKSTISDERVAQLEKIGFKWNSVSQLTLTKACNEQLSDLLQFKQQWRHCDVTQKYAKNLKLGFWERHQRSQYRLLKIGKKSSISDERISQLEKLGFQWNFVNYLKLNKACNKYLSELMNFKQQWGHCDVPQKYAKIHNIGRWVSRQRIQNKLVEERRGGVLHQ